MRKSDEPLQPPGVQKAHRRAFAQGCPSSIQSSSAGGREVETNDAGLVSGSGDGGGDFHEGAGFHGEVGGLRGVFGVGRGMWHALSHWGDASGKTEDDDGKTSWTSPEVKRQQYLGVIHYHHQQVAWFFERLKSIKEGDGTLLDNCLILYGSPFEDGNKHASKRVPVMLAGKAGGRLKPGRQLNYQGQPREGIYISMLDALGVRVEKIGNTDKALAIS